MGYTRKFSNILGRYCMLLERSFRSKFQEQKELRCYRDRSEAAFPGAEFRLTISLGVLVLAVFFADGCLGATAVPVVSKEHLLRQGLDFAKKGQYDKAVSVFSEAIALGLENDTILVERAAAYQHLEQHKQAVSDATKAIKFNPKNSNAFRIRGVSYYEMGNLDEAATDLSTAIMLQPRLANLYTIRATIYTFQGRSEPALDDIDMAMRLGEDSPETHHAKAVILKTLGRYSEAIEEFSSVLTHDLRSPESFRLVQDARMFRGECYICLGKYEDALKDLNWSIERSPEDPRARELRAWAYILMREFAKASTDLEYLVQSGQSNEWVYMSLTNVSLQTGDFVRAKTANDQLLRQYKNSTLPEVYFHRGVLLLRARDINGAKQAYELGLNLSSEQSDVASIEEAIGLARELGAVDQKSQEFIEATISRMEQFKAQIQPHAVTQLGACRPIVGRRK